MIDAKHEKLIPTNAARRLPWIKGRCGNDLSLASMTRWCTRGVRGVVLETIRIGGTIYTSEEATLRFIDKLNPSAVPNTSKACKSREIADADRRLDKADV